MTALPRPTGGLLTSSAYAELGEDDGYRSELQEGNLVMAPSPTLRHMIASGAMFAEVRAQLRSGLRVIQDVDIDLQLAPIDEPGFVRRPDLVVVRQDAVDRVDREGGLLRAAETLLVVEILSPGSRRTDRVIKWAEYAEAGIPHYWIVDLEPPVSLTACNLAPGLTYQDAGPVVGVFTTNAPSPMRLDLSALR